MSSLLSLLKDRYLETLRSVNSRWKILIVDEHTKVLLNSVLTTYEILDEGVQQMEVITNNRSSQARLPAIYILMPTSQNVDLVLRDYNNNPLRNGPEASGSGKLTRKKDSQPAAMGPGSALVEGPKYAAAHLHFVDGIDDALVSRITGTLPGEYLLALTELYVNFHALEPRVFSLRSPQTFFTLYAPPARSAKEGLQIWEEDVAWMSRALVNALATLGEYPYIRYYNPPSTFHAPLGPAVAAGEHVAKRLATRLQSEMDAYARDNTDFPPVADPPRPRGILFITDRSMDLYAPLLHEFTYQAMCNDLLEIKDGSRYHYSFQNASGGREEKEVSLTDADNVWTEVRHMHMKDALDKLIADFRVYAGEHGGKFGAEGGSSLNDMKDMLASLPQLQEAKQKLSLHLTMAEKCMSLFEEKKLPLSASVEQCCATGVQPDGSKSKTLVEEMVPLLDDRSVSSSDKLRIIALYILHRDGVPEGDKMRLYQHARLALHEMDAINNLSFLGVEVSKDSGKKRKPLFKQRDDEDAYDISRYQPAVKVMLEDHFANSLDQNLFPYVRDAPLLHRNLNERTASSSTAGSLRSARPQWTASRAVKKVAEPKQRVIVFMAGGMTYSEIRAAYKVSESSNKDIFIGSSNVITPEQFIRDLSNLDRGSGADTAYHANTYQPPPKSRGDAIPPPAAKLPQAAFDRRFSTQGPPPSSTSSVRNRDNVNVVPSAGSVSSLGSGGGQQSSGNGNGGGSQLEKEHVVKKKLFGRFGKSSS